MGVRPEKWPKERWPDMAVFFSQIGYKPTGEWKEEIVFFDPGKTSARRPPADRRAVFPDGTPASLRPDQDPREVFADWLIAAEESLVRARNIVNRVWSWLLGRGIIHEPDDIRPDNPPSNPELLAYLERELVAAHYDLKHVYRLILNSQTYQLSSIPASDKPEADGEFRLLSAAAAGGGGADRRLCQITGTTEKYSSPIPEPFTFIPESQRSIELADGSISSPFLEMFGRPARDTGSGIGAEQSSHGRPAAAPAEFQPYPPEDRAEPQAPRVAAIEAQAARDRRRALPDDPLALPDGRGIEDVLADYAQPGRQAAERRDDGPGLGVDQQRGVSLPALIRAGWMAFRHR